MSNKRSMAAARTRSGPGSGSELRVQSGNRSRATWRWVGALVWGAVSAYSVYQVFFRSTPDWDRDFPLLAVVLAVFPGVTLVLVARAAWATLRASKFGEATLVIDRAPVDAGRTLSGRLLTGATISAGATGEFTLQCQQVVETQLSGDKTRTETRILYEYATSFVIPDDVAQNGIPVRFDVPPDGLATSIGANPITWVLSVAVKTPGIDADMAFEVPVRRAETDG